MYPTARVLNDPSQSFNSRGKINLSVIYVFLIGLFPILTNIYAIMYISILLCIYKYLHCVRQ